MATCGSRSPSGARPLGRLGVNSVTVSISASNSQRQTSTSCTSESLTIVAESRNQSGEVLFRWMLCTSSSRPSYGVEQPLQLGVLGIEPAHEADLDQRPSGLVPLGLDQPQRRGAVQGQRLLAEGVLAVREAGEDLLLVGEPGRRDEHGLHGVVGDQVERVGDGAYPRITRGHLGGPRGVGVGDGDQLGVGYPGRQPVGVVGADGPDTDDADPQRTLRHSSTSSIGVSRGRCAALFPMYVVVRPAGGVEVADLADRDVPPGLAVGGVDQRVGLDVDHDRAAVGGRRLGVPDRLLQLRRGRAPRSPSRRGCGRWRRGRSAARSPSSRPVAASR